MASINTFVRPGLILGAALLGLAACNTNVSTDEDQLAWTQAALERGGELEVVAVDREAGVLTVREKESGQTSTVQVDEVVAVLPEEKRKAAAARKPASAPAQSPAPAPSAEPAATPATEPAPASPAASPAPAAEPSDEAEGESMLAQQGERASPTQSASGSGDFASTGSAGARASASQSMRSQSADTPVASGPGVVASGPGYSIRKVSASSAMPSREAEELWANGDEPSVSTAALVTRSEPIVCQGERLMHINNRNLRFDGNAVTAEDGCEIHITNSHIAASGVGVIADAANVHIKNSTIEGESGSLEASGGAQVYLQSSTFKGLSRRMDSATVHDMGGNVWN